MADMTDDHEMEDVADSSLPTDDIVENVPFPDMSIDPAISSNSTEDIATETETDIKNNDPSSPVHMNGASPSHIGQKRSATAAGLPTSNDAGEDSDSPFIPALRKKRKLDPHRSPSPQRKDSNGYVQSDEDNTHANGDDMKERDEKTPSNSFSSSFPARFKYNLRKNPRTTLRENKDSLTGDVLPIAEEDDVSPQKEEPEEAVVVPGEERYDHLSIWTDRRCLLHRVPDIQTQFVFVESPERLARLLSMIHECGWDRKSKVTHWELPVEVPPLENLIGIHTKEYLTLIKNKCKHITQSSWNARGDTYLCSETFKAAKISASLVIEATQHVLENSEGMDDRNVAVVLNRPPGHHCNGKEFSGFCFINNTAVAIEQVLEEKRVVILDIDIHHGNGTEEIFYSDPNVLHISVHQFDGSFFPMTGKRNCFGPSRRHPAYGTNINVPVKGLAGDHDIVFICRELLWPIIREFNPEFAFYCVGTDGVQGDASNCSTTYTPLIFGQIAFELNELVKRMVVTTEGGYTNSYLESGMYQVLQGVTTDDRLEAILYESYDPEVVLQSTKDTVNLTKQDLKKIYRFENTLEKDEVEKRNVVGIENEKRVVRDGQENKQVNGNLVNAKEDMRLSQSQSQNGDDSDYVVESDADVDMEE